MSFFLPQEQYLGTFAIADSPSKAQANAVSEHSVHNFRRNGGFPAGEQI